jgi:hypothetical protein
MGESGDVKYCLQCHTVLVDRSGGNIRCLYCRQAYPRGFRLGPEWGWRGVPQFLRDRVALVPDCQRLHVMPTIDGPVRLDVDLVGPMVADLMADLSWLRRSGGCLLMTCLCLCLWWSYARSG